MEFERLRPEDKEKITEMSTLAAAIVKEHFDPLIGPAQNDYMISLFQTPEAISQQLTKGYRYYFVKDNGEPIGFLAFYPRESSMYLSKFYLKKEERHKGYARRMLSFVIEEAEKENLKYVELNVNRFNSAVQSYLHMGFEIIREEKNDIGSGFVMDDYAMRLPICG